MMCAYKKRFRHTESQRKDDMERHRVKMAIYKPVSV